MQWFYSPQHELHDPDREIRAGSPTPGFEVANRAHIIKAQLLLDSDFSLSPVTQHGRAPIERVHDRAMVDWLEEAWLECRKFSEFREVVPDIYRHAQMTVPGAVAREPRDNPMARLGFYSFDSMTPIVEGTYTASRSAVDVALSALDAVLAGERVAYGLCRPPGHHASASMIGGYCFFNNAAIAASAMIEELGGPIAIVDVDFHHGNGTQSIFYERDDAFYLSLHGAPDRAYPYFLGRSDEKGSGDGIGWNHNVELEKGCGDQKYLDLLSHSLELATQKDVVGVIVSLGVDTFEHDPISDLGLTKSAYFPMGRLLAQLDLPTVVLQEGGYNQVELGVNVRSFLRGIGGLDDVE